MDTKDLQKKDLVELKKLLSEKRKEKSTTSFNLKMGKIKNVKVLASLKKDIAHILTTINQQSN